jgi:AcrR family transcriptional regulator
MLDDRSAATRSRILTQAEAYFRQFGYQKTTVADIAKALRMSPANIYRFFDSKRAINEAVAKRLMGEVEAELAAIAGSDLPPPERLARFAVALRGANAQRYVGDRMLHEMVAAALEESWEVVSAHIRTVEGMFASIIRAGVATGDFVVDDPAVAAACVHASLVKFCHPMLIAQCVAGDPGPDLASMLPFVLRGLGHNGALPAGALAAA